MPKMVNFKDLSSEFPLRERMEAKARSTVWEIQNRKSNAQLSLGTNMQSDFYQTWQDDFLDPPDQLLHWHFSGDSFL